jgi:hypothetical protein
MSLNGLAALAPLDWFRAFQGTANACRPSVLAARITPDPPRQLQGPPTPKPVRPLRPEHPVGHGPFKCRYCGRYGQPGACAGCGAPNAPVVSDRPAFPENRVVRADALLRSHMLTPNEQRRAEGLPPIPEFPMVKR